MNEKPKIAIYQEFSAKIPQEFNLNWFENKRGFSFKHI